MSNIDHLLESPSSHLHWIDYFVIALYFVIVMTVGFISSYKSRRTSTKGYFLASRSVNWIPIGASLFASNIGSGHFIGLAGSGAASGIGIAIYEIGAIFTIIALGWVFVPVYMASGVYTMPEYLQLRFGGRRIRIYLALIALLLYVFTKISADLYAGALFIQLSMGWFGDESLYISIIVLLCIAAVFTVAGGLTAVIWTDFVQTILMIIGAFILMILSFNAVGGYDELLRKYMSESEPAAEVSVFDVNNVSCGTVPEDALHMFRSLESDLPWTGVIFGITVSNLWYWCSDQVIVQRALASKNICHAKGGCILAGYLKLLPMFLLVLPGMASRVLFKDRVGCSDPEVCIKICGSRSGCSNIAYAELVIRLMPTGLSGMMLAVMMAALMSSLTSIFSSSSTIFTMDVWTTFRKNASDTELLIVGRLFVLFLVVISIIWIPIILAFRESQLFNYIQSITSYLSPPICAIFVAGVLFHRINEQGAFWGLLIGLFLGVFRFVTEFSFSSPSCGFEEDFRPEWIKGFINSVHFTHYGFILFVVTITITFIISLLTPPIPEEQLYRLTFWTRHSRKLRRPLSQIEQQSEKSISESLEVCPCQSELFEQKKDTQDENRSQMESRIIRTLKKLFGLRDGKVGQDKVSALSSRERTRYPEEEVLIAAGYLRESRFFSRLTKANAVVLVAITVLVLVLYA